MTEIEARQEIGRNVRFMLDELPSLEVPAEVRSRLQRLCDEFRDALNGMTPLPLGALDDMVRSLDGDPRLATASILLSESGANILRAAARLPPPRPALFERRFDCVLCGRACGLLRLFDNGDVATHTFTSTMGPAQPVREGEFERLRAIVESGDAGALHAHDFEFASFYCPQCKACYCQGHWYRWDVYDDDGWHDSIRGRCPKGHERMLED